MQKLPTRSVQSRGDTLFFYQKYAILWHEKSKTDQTGLKWGKLWS